MTRPRHIRAILIAPIAAPIVVWLGLLVRAVVTTHPGVDQTNPVPAALFLAFAMFVLGFPVALSATIALLLPASVVLERHQTRAIPMLAAIGAVGGAVLLPAFLRWLEPRGSIDLWPGAGAAAGAAVAFVFGRIVWQPSIVARRSK